MKRADEVRAEHKLDTITHYFLKGFSRCWDHVVPSERWGLPADGLHS